MAAIFAALSGGSVFYIWGWSSVLLVYYLLAAVFTVIAFRSVTMVRGTDAQFKAEHRLLSIALGMGVGLLNVVGILIAFWPHPF